MPRVLSRYDIVDTDPEPQFDHIVELAARMFEAPGRNDRLLDADRCGSRHASAATGSACRANWLHRPPQ